MTVYIEYVLIDNFVIDYLMLKATFATTAKRYSKGRLFLCAFLGAIIAITYPLLQVHSIILISVKVCSGLLIILLANSYKSTKELYVNAMLFFAYTFLTGGAIIGVFNILGLNASSELSVATMIIPVYIVLSFARAIINYVYRRKDVLTATVNVEMTAFGKTILARGFIDTGNGVYDKDSPVIFCDKHIFKQFLSGDLGQIKLKKINIFTVNGNSEKTAFKLQEIKIYYGQEPNIYSNVTTCIVDGVGDGYDVILHPALIGKCNNENLEQTKKIS